MQLLLLFSQRLLGSTAVQLRQDTAASVTAVVDAEGLLSAAKLGTADIEIVKHIDMRQLALSTPEAIVTVATNVRSIRVRSFVPVQIPVNLLATSLQRLRCFLVSTPRLHAVLVMFPVVVCTHDICSDAMKLAIHIGLLDYGSCIM